MNYIAVVRRTQTKSISENIEVICGNEDSSLVRLALLNYAVLLYRGADKFLARPGRKQANVSVRMT